MVSVADQTIARWFTPDFARRNPDEVAKARAILLRTDPVGYAGCCEAIGAMDQRDAIATIRCATLVIAGASDPATPLDHSQLIDELVERTRFVTLAPAAHLATVEQSDLATDLILDHLLGRKA